MKASEAQLPLTAHARVEDPWTSHAAARSVTISNRSAQAVLACFIGHDLTDEQLLERFRDLFPDLDLADSRIRTYRKDLSNAGELRLKGTATSSRGRASRVWGL